MSSFTCSGGSISTSSSSFWIYSGEGVARRTVGFFDNEDGRATSLLVVLDRLRCIHGGLFLACRGRKFLHVLVSLNIEDDKIKHE